MFLLHGLSNDSTKRASIFLQQKLKVADLDDRAKIVDAQALDSRSWHIGINILIICIIKHRLSFSENIVGSVIRQSKDVASETKDPFSRYVSNLLSYASTFIQVHCTFIEGGLSVLPLIAMAATSCKRQSIVKKTSGDPAQSRE